MSETPFGRWTVGGFLLALSVVLSGSMLLPGPAHADPKFVQSKVAGVKSGSSISVTFRRQNKPGDLIVAYVVWDNSSAVSLKDSQGNAYVSAIGPTQFAGDSAQIFYVSSIAGGSNTVTADFATATTARGVLYVHEYSGVDPISPLDAAVAASGSSPLMETGFLNAANAKELLFIAAESDGKAIRRLRPARSKTRGSKYSSKTADKVVAAAGIYNATATQKGTAWVMQLLAFKPAGSSTSRSGHFRYPLEVSANRRYLVDQDNTPFLITGDSPQALVANLSEAEAESFFANREAAGFNLVWINLLCADYTGGRADGSTYDGIVPFTTENDLATPNRDYFARVDRMLQLAAHHGLVVLLDPAESGSFLSVLKSNGVTKSRNYGRYLGTRYRSFDNIVWMSGNDFLTWPDPGDDAVTRAVALGIRDTDDRHIHTVELDFPVSGSLDDPEWEPIIELNASYTYYPTYAQVLLDYNRANALPTFMVEANYEFENNTGTDEGTPQILRRQEYWTLLSGAAGQLYGNFFTWQFAGGWESNLDTPGSLQMRYVKALFEPRRWYDLVPDQTHSVVTAGYGTFADSGPLGDNDYLTAARTPDGALVIAYMPTIRTITVDMSQLSGPAHATWYDPSNGAFTAIDGSPLANTGTRNFSPPGANSDGDGDWLLLLETTVPPGT
jgi:hypothetical protein